MKGMKAASALLKFRETGGSYGPPVKKAPVTKASFKEEIDKYEEAEGKLPDNIKVAAMVQSCPTAVADHLRLHGAKKTFAQAEKMATDLYKVKELGKGS